MRKVAVVVGLCVSTALAVRAEEPVHETSSDEAALFDRLGVREQILETQTATALASAKERTLLAYRLARRRELGFFANPENRLGEARSFDVALVALRRGLDESQTLSRELDRVRSERATLENALVERALQDHSPAAPAGTQVSADAARSGDAHLPRPVRGAPVAVPGARRDGPTKVELRHDSLQLLTRLNDPVRAVAAGAIRRVEPLPQGGFAVVVAHDDGRTTIVSGLRDFAVTPGDHVTTGQVLGVAGRNLDGAAVISIEIWQKRRPADAARLLRGRL